MSEREQLAAIRAAMQDWTPEVRTALAKAGHLYLGESAENPAVRLVYGIMGRVGAVLASGDGR